MAKKTAYTKHYQKYYPGIRKMLSIAEKAVGKPEEAKLGIKALNDARKASIKHAIPFRTRACILSDKLLIDMDNVFIPPSLFEKKEEFGMDLDVDDLISLSKLTSIPLLSFLVNDPEWCPSTDHGYDD
jgi:hypothetical protein